MAVFHLFLALLALMAAGKADEEVHKQSFKREQLGVGGQQVTRRLDRLALSLDKSIAGEVVFKRNSSEVIGRQGRASKSRPSRQSCTAKTGMSFTRCKQSKEKRSRQIKYKHNIHGTKPRQIKYKHNIHGQKTMTISHSKDWPASIPSVVKALSFTRCFRLLHPFSFFAKRSHTKENFFA